MNDGVTTLVAVAALGFAGVAHADYPADQRAADPHRVRVKYEVAARRCDDPAGGAGGVCPRAAHNAVQGKQQGNATAPGPGTPNEKK